VTTEPDDGTPARPDDAPDAVPPASEEDAKKKDIRISSRRDMGVEVTRDLTASGRLARGDSSNMSRLSFSSRGRSRTELDPELQALRNEPPAPRAPAEPPAPPAPPAAPPPPAAPVHDESTKAEDGLLGRIGRLFGSD